MQHLEYVSEERFTFQITSILILAQVRFLAYIELNHMLHRLCGPPSIPLSFTVAGVLPRWFTYRFRYATHPKGQTASKHRLGRGLPGYLILFAPHAFVPQRQ